MPADDTAGELLPPLSTTALQAMVPVASLTPYSLEPPEALV